MYKLFISIFFLSILNPSFAQVREIDSLKKLLANTKEDTIKVALLCDLSFYEQNSQQAIALIEEALSLAKKNGFESGEASCYFEMGNHYLQVNNNITAMHYFLEAMKIWERLGNNMGRSACYIAIGSIFKEQDDYQNALAYMQKADAAKPDSAEDLAYGTALFYGNYADVYYRLNNQDSALKYFLRSYESFNGTEIKYQLNLALNGLGNVQQMMGHSEIALGYYREAVRNGIAFSDTAGLSETYLQMAKLFNRQGQRDSSLHYGALALSNAQSLNAFKIIIASSKLLSQIYRGVNDKQALDYLQLSQDAIDSLYKQQRSKEFENMYINEREREKAAVEKVKEEAIQRRQNLEFSLIAIGILGFIILFLLLSRSIIVNERWITFFGVLGLLIVFEFINLLIHPTLAHITHESPVLLLIAYVIVASLLIPIHHRLEKWIIKRVTEKNKMIRLANAKKTIEELEAKSVKAEAEN